MCFRTAKGLRSFIVTHINERMSGDVRSACRLSVDLSYKPNSDVVQVFLCFVHYSPRHTSIISVSQAIPRCNFYDDIYSLIDETLGL